MVEMSPKEKGAYEWALSQNFTSVAAGYARTLAEYIQRAVLAEKKEDGITSPLADDWDGSHL
jgi:hypothetical protein